jgi:HK97 family phage prohead protease|nr:MAG TPA: prohead serine protease [Caudoviricetes sp.]
MEIRSFYEERAMPTVLKDAEDKDTRTIEGYAVVFEKESRMMVDWWTGKKFVEVIKRGAVTSDDLTKWDIKALMEHDKSRLLARSFNGKGSLTLTIDDYGVKYRFDAPNTVEGDNAIELIKRGDLFGSSFAFTTDEDANVSYTKRTDGSLLREVSKLDRMYDISVVTDPAYFGTDVTVRSVDGFIDEPPQDESYKKDIENLRSLI